MTPEEREAIFKEVQERSRAAKQKRMKERQGSPMSATMSDTVRKNQPVGGATSPATPPPDLSPIQDDPGKDKGKMSYGRKAVFENIRRRRERLERSLNP